MFPKNIKPYIKASIYVISEVTGMKVEVGEIVSKVSPYRLNNVVVVFGVFGNIKGQTSFSLDEQLAMRISSKMLGNEECKEVNELVKSAISELGNMIMGHTANAFYKKHIIFDITPPSILTGSNLFFSGDKMDILCIPLIIDNESILEINIATVPNSL